MDEMERPSHTKWDYKYTKWDCKYHVVFIPNCVHRALFRELRPHLGEVFHELAMSRESRIDEGHLLRDYVYMMIAIPPKYAVSGVVEFIKSESACYLARISGKENRNFVWQHFWARGCYVSTVGRDETAIREYVMRHEQEDKRLDQDNLWRLEPPGPYQ